MYTRVLFFGSDWKVYKRGYGSRQDKSSVAPPSRSSPYLLWGGGLLFFPRLSTYYLGLHLERRGRGMEPSQMWSFETPIFKKMVAEGSKWGRVAGNLLTGAGLVRTFNILLLFKSFYI